MNERIKQLFEQSIENKISMAEVLQENIVKAAQRLVQCLLNEGKIFLCGNGGSSANCSHFLAMMINHFEMERPAFPVIMLGSESTLVTAFTHENQDQLFVRQLQALARSEDVLLVLSTKGNANNILNAVTTAHDCSMDVIALGGREGGVLNNHLGPEDIVLSVPSDISSHIREAHLFILHCFCDLIERSLFGPAAE